MTRDYPYQPAWLGLKRWAAIRLRDDYRREAAACLELPWFAGLARRYYYLFADYEPHTHETERRWRQRYQAEPAPRGLPGYVQHRPTDAPARLQAFHTRWRTIVPLPPCIRYPHPAIVDALEQVVRVVGTRLRAGGAGTELTVVQAADADDPRDGDLLVAVPRCLNMHALGSEVRRAVREFTCPAADRRQPELPQQRYFDTLAAVALDRHGLSAAAIAERLITPRDGDPHPDTAQPIARAIARGTSLLAWEITLQTLAGDRL